MKKLTIFFCLVLVSSVIYSQEIVDSTKRWNTVIHRLPSYTIITESIKFEGDTTIDFVDYKKVFRSTAEFQTIWEAYGFIRETVDKKVYYRTDTAQDFLLYDFNLGLNEIVEVYGISGLGNSYILRPMTFMLSKIDSIFLGDVYRQQFHLNLVYNGDTSPNVKDFWIEGIGSKSGILHWDAGLVGADYYQLLCYSQNDSLIYQDSSYTSCSYFLTGINEISSAEKIKIYPNPIIDKVTITIGSYNINKEYILKIYDGLGREVFENKINSTYIFDRNELKSGLYFFRIVCNGESIQTEKIMIE